MTSDYYSNVEKSLIPNAVISVITGSAINEENVTYYMLDNMVLLTYHLLPLSRILGGGDPALSPVPHLEVEDVVELVPPTLRSTDTERMYM
jgi:hypothetical protein